MQSQYLSVMFPGGFSGGETPVPIPNTEVKPSSADGTSHVLSGRVGRCRDLKMNPAPDSRGRVFYLDDSKLFNIRLRFWFEGSNSSAFLRLAMPFSSCPAFKYSKVDIS
jgi:hypothetical protein